MEPKILRAANLRPQPARSARDREDERNQRRIDDRDAVECGLYTGLTDPGELTVLPGTLDPSGAMDAVDAVDAIEVVGAVAEGGGVLGAIGEALGAIFGLLRV